MRRALAALVILCAAAPPLRAGAAGAVLRPPIPGPRGTIVWNGPGPPLLDPLPVLRSAGSGPVARADSLALWSEVATRGSAWAPLALRTLALAAAESGAAARADSLWRRLARDAEWADAEANGARADLALARGDTSGAETILGSADHSRWSEAEQAAWLGCRAELRLARGDAAAARGFARDAMVRFPATAGAALALPLFERATARRGAASVEEERAAAEVEALHGQRAAAATRLAAVQRRVPAADRWRVALRRGAILRADRHFAESRAAFAQARTGAPSSIRPRIALELARTFVAANDAAAARAQFQIAAAAPDTSVASAARWERGRLEESVGHWTAAAAAFGGLARERGERATEAAFRAGLAALAAGDREAARDEFARAVGEGARFWQAVLLRPHAVMVADTTLRAIAGSAGYTFYRVAARESVGVTPALPAGVASPDSLSGVLALAAGWVAGGDDAEAAALLEGWASRDPRFLAGEPATRAPGRWLGAAAVAYAAGENALGVRCAARAFEESPGRRDGAAVAPWLYPPAFARERARADSATHGAVEPALLAAVVWQESRFEPRARSRSDALGLLQLKVGTAGDVARERGEPPPGADDLADPERNLRYGAGYLAGLLERSGGDVVRALAAYNAGPSVAARWVSLRDRGGLALDCELIARPETQDYVKRILAARAAYRELAPVPGAP
jgi:soluble lytic murein transglycosylase